MLRHILQPQYHFQCEVQNCSIICLKFPIDVILSHDYIDWEIDLTPFVFLDVGGAMACDFLDINYDDTC